MKITNQITRYYILFYALYSMTQRIIPISVFCVGPLAGILYKLIVGEQKTEENIHVTNS